MYGDEIIFDGDTYYAFPSPKQLAVLTQEDLAPLRAGIAINTYSMQRLRSQAARLT